MSVSSVFLPPLLTNGTYNDKVLNRCSSVTCGSMVLVHMHPFKYLIISYGQVDVILYRV